MPCARGCCATQADHWRSIQLNGRPPSEQSGMEKRWKVDMPAYKRLRRNGLQPRGIDGSAALEKHASTKMEVEMGHLLRTKEEMTRAREGMQRAADMELGIVTD